MEILVTSIERAKTTLDGMRTQADRVEEQLGVKNEEEMELRGMVEEIIQGVNRQMMG